MQTLAIGDIHGGLKGLIQLLKRAEVTQNDTLIFLGDYVDGWSESAQVIQYLINLSKTNTCIFIKGNHDAWCQEWLTYGIVNDVWFNHGGKETIESYSNFSKEEKSNHRDFFEDMHLYHIDSEKRFFVHAGFTSMQGVEKEIDIRNFYFDRTLWEMARNLNMVDENKRKKIDARFSFYSEIYIGHTPTTNYFKMHPMNAINVWNIDTGAAFTGRLSAIDVYTKAIFQSDILKDLYPNELGRNKN